MLARLGNSNSLRVLLERALDSPSLPLGWIYETTWYPQVLQQLGDSYDARGDRAKATSYYQMYVELRREPRRGDAGVILPARKHSL